MEDKLINCTGLYVYVPTWSDIVFTNCWKATATLAHTMGALDVPMTFGAYSHGYIAESRSTALTAWFDKLPSYSHILFVDADTGFGPAQILHMLAADKPVIGGVYPMRTLERKWVISAGAKCAITDDWNFIRLDRPGEGIGGGCMLLRRDAVGQMIEAYPELVDTNIERMTMKLAVQHAGLTRVVNLFQEMTLDGGLRKGEDLSFCERWRSLGGEVWGSIGHMMTHVGIHEFAGCFKDEVGPQAEVTES